MKNEITQPYSVGPRCTTRRGAMKCQFLPASASTTTTPALLILASGPLVAHPLALAGSELWGREKLAPNSIASSPVPLADRIDRRTASSARPRKLLPCIAFSSRQKKPEKKPTEAFGNEWRTMEEMPHLRTLRRERKWKSRHRQDRHPT